MAKSDTSIRLRLPGREVASAAPASSHADIAQLLKVEQKKAVEVDVYLRGAAFETVPFDANPNDVVELEYEGGLRQWIRVDQLRDLDNHAPYLLFLHGTASSVSGSFCGLAPAPDDAGEPVSPDDWHALRQKYPGHILGLQHKTLSVSPVQNALDAARLLPQGAQLHLVSHSRGGLVGELLCVNQMPGEYRSAFARMPDKVENDISREVLEARTEEAERFDQLAAELLRKQFAVQRFVRVACPGLAKGGLDRLADCTDRVESGDLVAEFYAPMLNRLQGRYRVESAGYDWRRGLDEIANKLRMRIRRCLEGNTFEKQAIHFVAHGAGALGLLRLAADHDFWDPIAERQGRIVLLGAPIHGCAALALFREAKAPFNRLLRMADHQSKNRPEEIFKQFRSFEEFRPESVQGLNLRNPSELGNLVDRQDGKGIWRQKAKLPEGDALRAPLEAIMREVNAQSKAQSVPPKQKE